MAGLETPATVAARRAGNRFRALGYEHGAASESYGLEAAGRLGLDPASAFKTPLAPGDLAELTSAETARPTRG